MATAPKVEDRLLRVLAENAREDELIDVVFRFEMPIPVAPAERLPVKDLREGIARTMSERIEAALARAGEVTGETPAHVSLFPMLGSALVQAHRPYVKELLKQACVRGAVLNTERTSEE